MAFQWWFANGNAIDQYGMDQSRSADMIDVKISRTEIGKPLLTHAFCYGIIPIYTAYLSLSFRRSFAFSETVQQNMTIYCFFFASIFIYYAVHLILVFTKQNMYWPIPWNVTFQLHIRVDPWRQERISGNGMNYHPTKKPNALICQPNKTSFIAQQPSTV